MAIQSVSSQSNRAYSIAEGASPKLQKALTVFHERMLSSGFGVVQDPRLMKDKEIIYNRGLNADGAQNGQSNFFVFARIEKDEFQVHFSNPDFSAEAQKLSAKEVQCLFSCSSFTPSWVEKTLAKITQTASKKPANAYFPVVHGHWGETNGVNLISANLDDGLSNEFQIIRQLMFYNTDYDATGYHNNFVREYAESVSLLEQSAGIVKVPSVELTFPLSYGARNGFHINLWFSSMNVAAQYSENILSRRSGNYPPYAPLAEPKDILQINAQLIRDKKLAVGLAHPLGGPAVGNNKAAVMGLLDRVADTDYTLEWALNFVKEHTQGVGIFNPTLVSDMEIEFKNPSEKKYIAGMLEKWKMGRKPTLNAVNMAFSLEMQEQYGKFRYADHDIHNYPEVGYDSHIHAHGQLFNSFALGSASPQFSMAKPSSANFVTYFLSSSVKDGFQPFMPYDFSKGYLFVAKQRRNDSVLDTLEDKLKEYASYPRRLLALGHDLIYGGFKSMTR